MQDRKISAKKLADIRKQIPYIPVSHRPFYTSLVPSDHESDETDSGEEAPAAASRDMTNVRRTSKPAEKLAKKKKCQLQQAETG